MLSFLRRTQSCLWTGLSAVRPIVSIQTRQQHKKRRRSGLLFELNALCPAMEVGVYDDNFIVLQLYAHL